MKRITLLALVAALALPAAAARPADDALALVPTDAVTAGMLRMSDLRTSPLAARVFAEFDKTTVEGDAAKFLAETHLRPIDDVDLAVFAAQADPHGKALVAFEGRFEPERLAKAVAARGAQAKSASGTTYYLLKDEKHPGHEGDGAVAFVSSRLLVAGSEDAVVAALAARAAGGTGFRGGAGLGAQLGKVNSSATGWLLVDRTKLPEAKGSVTITLKEGDAARNVVGAMNLVSTFAFEMTVKGDSVRLSGAGYSDDAETRELLEDALRGVLAAMRIGAQEKPDVVSAIRKFKVASDRNAVTISGTLDGAAIKALAAAKAEHEKARAAAKSGANQ